VLSAVVAFMLRHAPLFMVGGVLVGLALPPLAEAVRPAVVTLSVSMLMISMLRVDPGRLRAAVARPVHILLVLAVILLILPALVGLGAMALGAPGWLATGLTLASAAPPLSSAAAFAILVGIDAALVTAISVPATLVLPLTAGAVTTLTPGLGAGVDVGALVLRLAALILVAFAFAFLVRRIAGPVRVARAAPALDAAMVAAVAAMGVGVMHDIGLALRADPLGWTGIFAATWAVSLASCALTVALFWRAGRDRALAAGLTAASKNMAVMVAAVLGAVEARIALVVITAQLPIFLAPLLLKPLFARLGAAGAAR
jgi:BASS family bile acid:Na+ symporter